MRTPEAAGAGRPRPVSPRSAWTANVLNPKAAMVYLTVARGSRPRRARAARTLLTRPSA
ncbi:MAG TPA: hypothetical protein VHH15_19585 [Actinophytocola sp.]|nr:hypothetical protein [Actinophytocola sp.]